MLCGLIPGIVIGSYLLSSVNPGWIKFMTYTAILPLILLQAAGVRKHIHSERAVGVPFGAGVGILYSVTTISGPPMALMLNNQGYVKHDFRAGLALVRVTESALTALAYYFLGLYSPASNHILHLIVPSVIIGIPLGAFIIRHLEAETFRRVCMSFDAWVVGFGLSRTLIEMGLLASPMAYSVLGATLLTDFYLLYVYFRKKGSTVELEENTLIILTEEQVYRTSEAGRAHAEVPGIHTFQYQERPSKGGLYGPRENPGG